MPHPLLKMFKLPNFPRVWLKEPVAVWQKIRLMGWLMGSILTAVSLGHMQSAIAQAVSDPALDAQVETTAEPVEETVESLPSIEEILTQTPDEADYVNVERCISAINIRSIEALDDRHIAVRVGRGEHYLAQLSHGCPGISRGKTLIYETRNRRLCQHDTIRGSFGIGGQFSPSNLGPPCALPKFRSVTKEELALIKDTLKVKRQERREARRTQRALAKKLRDVK